MLLKTNVRSIARSKSVSVLVVLVFIIVFTVGEKLMRHANKITKQEIQK